MSFSVYADPCANLQTQNTNCSELELSSDDFYNIAEKDICENISTEPAVLVTKDNDNYEVNKIENKLFLSLSDQFYLKKELIRNTHLYIICMKNDYNKDFDYKILFEKYVDTDVFLQLCGELVIFKAPYSMIYNNEFKKMAKYIDGDFLGTIFSEEFENQELVLLQFNLIEKDAKLNVSLYKTSSNFSDISALCEFIAEYYKNYGSSAIIEKFSDFINDLHMCSYWKNGENGKLFNMDEIFKNRDFKYKARRNELFQKSVEAMSKQEVKEMNKIFKCTKSNSVSINYPTELLFDKGDEKQEESKVFDTQLVNKNQKLLTSFVEKADLFTSLKSKSKRTYYLKNEPEIQVEMVRRLFELTTDKNVLFHLINMVIVSKDICHYLFDPVIYEKAIPIITDNKPFYKYTMGYMWLALYTNECIMGTRTTKNNTFVIDIHSASKLPIFPTPHNDIHQNPYVCLPISETVADLKENVMSAFPPVFDCENYNGISTLEEFRIKMNIFMTGFANSGFPLQNIDWKYFAISGSIIPACLQKNPYIMAIIGDKNWNYEYKFKCFCETFYSNSDIDLMCHATNLPDYFKHVRSVIRCLNDFFGANTTKVDKNRSMATFITTSFVSKIINIFNKKFIKNYTCEKLVELAREQNPNELHEFLYEYYVLYKTKSNANFRKNNIHFSETDANLEKYFLEIMAIGDLNINLINNELSGNTEDCDITLRINDFITDETEKVPDSENIVVAKFSEGVKFKISNPKMLHDIELFKSSSPDFFGLVSKFHLPCVRSYYQDNNVYMLPSCITALMTGINIDYKYFAGVRDPIDIINKYRMRGFSSILSKKELEYFVDYNMKIKTFNGIFHGNIKAEIVGYKNLHHKMFKPLNTHVKENNIVPPNDTQKDLENYYSRYKTNGIINFLNLCSINSDGNVRKYNHSIAKLYLE